LTHPSGGGADSTTYIRRVAPPPAPPPLIVYKGTLKTGWELERAERRDQSREGELVEVRI